MEGATAQDGFWAHLGALCESAAAGRLLRAPEGDTQIDPDARLVVHFRDCGEREHRFPLHVDENRSRTWVFIRHEDALELRHDHRHPDGTEEDNTWYGARTVHDGTVAQQEPIAALLADPYPTALVAALGEASRTRVQADVTTGATGRTLATVLGLFVRQAERLLGL
jgi:hypothetical protein